MTSTFVAKSESELGPIARDILERLKDHPVILLRGEMGSGKTTLVKQILKECGNMETSSPTFSLVNQYDSQKGIFYHFDLYRIEKLEELYDIGFEEYVNSGRFCLIEWPEIAEELIPHRHLEVHIDLLADGSRSFKIIEEGH